MAIKIGRGDYVPNIYPCVKLHYDPFRGFCPPHIRSCLKMFTRLVFWGVLPTLYRLGRCADFDDQYVKRRRFAQGCAFWGSREQFFTLWPHFRQKRKFWSIFDGTENFGSKWALTWGLRQKTPLKRPATPSEVGWWIGKSTLTNQNMRSIPTPEVR